MNIGNSPPNFFCYGNVSVVIACCDLFCSWYHGNISRDDVEKLMNPSEDGMFLVRESANYPGDYTLCVAFEGKVEHYHISIKENRLTVDDETYFANMIKLVEVRNAFLLCKCLCRH